MARQKGKSKVSRPKLTRSKPTGRAGQRTVVNTAMVMSGSQGMAGY